MLDNKIILEITHKHTNAQELLEFAFSIFPAPYEARFKIQVDERKKFQASFFSRKSAAGIFSEAA